MTIKCHVYQAKNGLIYLSCGDGRSYSALTLQQITDLGVDVYALDDFNLENFREAYPASQSPQEASEEQPASDKYLEKAVGAMLETGTIQFKPFSWCFRVVDMIVTSEVFTDKEVVLTVNEDEIRVLPLPPAILNSYPAQKKHCEGVSDHEFSRSSSRSAYPRNIPSWLPCGVDWDGP